MHRNSPHYYTAIKNLRLVFRKNGDIGVKRQLPTETQCQMEANLSKFFNTWKEYDNDNVNKVFTEETEHAIENLQTHIRKGCLHNVPVGVGTNRNERIHKALNQTMSKIPKITVKLMTNLLTLVFYRWNWNREYPTIPCPPIWENKTVS